MQVIADLHMHGPYSRAASGNLTTKSQEINSMKDDF